LDFSAAADPPLMIDALRCAFRPHPEEARSAVSKDGAATDLGLTRVGYSRLTVPLMLRDAALRAAPQHEGERAQAVTITVVRY
jgi:hypothetical protein